MEQKPPSQPGVIFGLGMILGLALLDIGLVTLALLAPITALTVVRALLVLLTLPVLGVIFHGLAGLSNAGYLIDRNAIAIRWGATAHLIPLPDVEAIERGVNLGRVTHFRGIRWPGCWAGRGQIDGVGLVRFFCTAPLERQLVIRTASGSYAVSPENPDKFMDLYTTQRSMGPAERRGRAVSQPRILHHGFFSDRTAHLLLAVGGVLNLILFVVLSVHFNRLPSSMPLHFDGVGMPDRTGPPGQLFVLAGLGAAVWMAEGILGYVSYRRLGERMAAYLLWGTAAGLQILLLVAVVGLVKA